MFILVKRGTTFSSKIVAILLYKWMKADNDSKWDQYRTFMIVDGYYIALILIMMIDERE